LKPLELQNSEDLPSIIQNLKKFNLVETVGTGVCISPNLAVETTLYPVANGMGYLTNRNLVNDDINEDTTSFLISDNNCLCVWIKNEFTYFLGGRTSIIYQIFEKEVQKPLQEDDSLSTSGQKLKCSVCGRELSIGAGFCSQCGTSFSSQKAQSSSNYFTVCSSCGTLNNQGAQFCRICGRKF
jgi:hypothetical protein